RKVSYDVGQGLEFRRVLFRSEIVDIHDGELEPTLANRKIVTRLPLADEAGDDLAVGQGRLQLAVVDVHDLGLDAERLVGGLDLGLTAAGEGRAGLAPVADVPVGDGDELHLVSLGGPHRPDAASLQFAIVRMGPET